MHKITFKVEVGIQCAECGIFSKDLFEELLKEKFKESPIEFLSVEQIADKGDCGNNKGENN